MIRFVQIGDQITEDANDFCFYNTVTDTFVIFHGTQVFANRQEFINMAKDTDRSSTLYKRCLDLIPKENRSL